MGRWKGVGDRIKGRLLEMGFEKAGRPNITGFCLEYRYLITPFYRWVNDEATPGHDNLNRLAKDLGVTPWWLLYGDQVNGSPAPPRPRAKVPPRGIMSTSRRGMARGRGRGYLNPHRKRSHLSEVA